MAKVKQESAVQEMVEHYSTQQSKQEASSSPGLKSSAGILAFVFIAIVISLFAGAFSFFLFQQLEHNKLQLNELKLEIGGQLSGKLDGVSGKFNSVSDRFTSVSDRISRFNSDVTKVNNSVQQLDNYTKQEFKQQANLFSQYKLQQQALVKSQQKSIKNLETRILQSQRTQQISNEQITHSLDQLYKQKGRTRNDWILSEVEYLLLIANHGLNLSFDVNTAIIALQEADGRLLDMADPGIIPIRKLIAEELIQLKAVPVLDIAGMQVILSALIEHSASLEVLNSKIPSVNDLLASANKDVVNTSNEIQQSSGSQVEPSIVASRLAQYKKNITEVVDKFLNELKNLVVYRNKKIAATALIAPEQKFFLQQHLSLKLESARKALLDGKNDLFHSLLTESQQLLTKYFDNNKQGVKSFSLQIKTLQAHQLSRKLPDISFSLNELKKYVAKLEQHRTLTDDVIVDDIKAQKKVTKMGNN